MVLPSLPAGRPVLPFQVLDDAHFTEMSALVDLTEPGPFFSKSHHLGRFVGSFVDGRLAAMAGERMMPGTARFARSLLRPC